MRRWDGASRSRYTVPIHTYYGGQLPNFLDTEHTIPDGAVDILVRIGRFV
jgi:hypothetical protein